MTAEQELHDALLGSSRSRSSLRASAEQVIQLHRRRAFYWWLCSWGCACVATAHALHGDWVWSAIAVLAAAGSAWHAHNQRGGLRLYVDHWRRCPICRDRLGPPP